MNIDVDNRQDKMQIDEQNLLKLATHALSYMGLPSYLELSISFVDEQEIQQLNTRYRNTNTVTDVLSFPCDIENLEQLECIVADAELDAGASSGVGAQAKSELRTQMGSEVNAQLSDVANSKADVNVETFASECGVRQTIAQTIELGDVVICPAIIDEQRHEFNTTFDEELSLMLVHSILHLLGFDHIDEQDRGLMQQKEREILESFSG